MPRSKDTCLKCGQPLRCGCGSKTKRMLRSEFVKTGDDRWRDLAKQMKTNDCPECIAWTASDWRTLQDLLRGDEEDCGCAEAK